MKIGDPGVRRLAQAGVFVLPSFIGLFVFTIIPIFASFFFALTNWDLQLHNIFKDNPLKWVGVENFIELFRHERFWQYLGNTLFLMMGLPIAVAGSLVAALLLHEDISRAGTGQREIIMIAAVLTTSLAVLVVLGVPLSGLSLLLAILFLGIVAGGLMFGTSLYRTLFYTPHFTAGVATFVLWKKLYNPQTGPVNDFLGPVLEFAGSIVNALPRGAALAISYGLLVMFLWFADLQFKRAGRMRQDGDAGWGGIACGVALPLAVALLAPFVYPSAAIGWGVFGITGILVLRRLPQFRRVDASGFRVPSGRFGVDYIVSFLWLLISLAVLGSSVLFRALPAMAANGLSPPGMVDRLPLGQTGDHDHGPVGRDRLKQYDPLPRGAFQHTG